MLLPFVLASPALACGGFFCNNVEPVEQTGEQIVFAIDDAAHTVTVDVRVSYAGPSTSFAWVVPVPGIPTLGVTSNGLFDALDLNTQPVHTLSVTMDACDYDADADTDSDSDGTYYSSSYTVADSGGASTVDVVAQAEVGPYETVTLQAETSAGLVAWLQENGYDVPATFDAAIAPYVAQGQYVVALKLLKDRDTGDLQPISMTYAGDVASIPIQLTSVAAAPGMPLEVYVFGAHRAVPISYLHVVPNPFVYDWFTGTSDWQDTIARAADEAGGHAFATDYAGSTTSLQGTFYHGEYDNTLNALPKSADVVAWWTSVTVAFPPTAALLDVFERQIPVPDGADASDVYNCVPCYAAYLDGLPFDPVAATADLDATLVQPLRDAEALAARYGHLSRLTSWMDAREMTVDPTFQLNADMPQDVDRLHTADLHYACAGGDLASAPRTLTVSPEGWTVDLLTLDELRSQQTTDYAYLSSLTTYAALRIEKTSAVGPAQVLTDQTPWLEAGIAALARGTDPDGPGQPGDPTSADGGSDEGGGGRAGGCGCESAPAGGSALAGALLGLVALRRRRS